MRRIEKCDKIKHDITKKKNHQQYKIIINKCDLNCGLPHFQNSYHIFYHE